MTVLDFSYTLHNLIYPNCVSFSIVFKFLSLHEKLLLLSGDGFLMLNKYF